jgi:hypothetical protein
VEAGSTLRWGRRGRSRLGTIPSSTNCSVRYSVGDWPVLRDAKGNRRLRGNILHVALTLKQTPWPLVRKRTIPTERPPLVDEI